MSTVYNKSIIVVSTIDARYAETPLQVFPDLSKLCAKKPETWALQCKFFSNLRPPRWCCQEFEWKGGFWDLFCVELQRWIEIHIQIFHDFIRDKQNKSFTHCLLRKVSKRMHPNMFFSQPIVRNVLSKVFLYVNIRVESNFSSDSIISNSWKKDACPLLFKPFLFYSLYYRFVSKFEKKQRGSCLNFLSQKAASLNILQIEAPPAASGENCTN